MVAQCEEGGTFEVKANIPMVSERRTSVRLQKLKASTNVLVKYKEDDDDHHDEEEDRAVLRNNKVQRAYKKRKVADRPPPMADEASEPAAENTHLAPIKKNQLIVDTKDASTDNQTVAIAEDKSVYARVTETLRIFNKYYLHFVQEEEKRKLDQENKKGAKSKEEDKRCSKAGVDRKKKKSAKFQENNMNDDNMKNVSRRPDLKATSKMKETGTILYPEKRHGPIPGIDVGHQFYSRTEMVAIGFHSHSLNGIDYIGQSAAAGRRAGKDSENHVGKTSRCGFMYIKGLKFAKSVKLPPNAPGCNCRGFCTDPRICACAKLNGSDFPYVNKNGGRLIEPKAVVFECGPNCGCGPDCISRTSQRGLRYRLEVFRTPYKGWGVRSWDFIPSGAPVCEYIGVLMKTDDIDPSTETNYVFDIDCLQTMKGLDGRERRLGDVSLPEHLQKDDSNSVPEFCINAGSTGNVARFINHSCQPNLFIQCVLSGHHEIKQARLMLIAADNIPPLKELTYDYGYAVNSVVGPDGKIKQMPCYCGAADCRKRLF